MLTAPKKQAPFSRQREALRAVRKGSPGRVAVRESETVCRCRREGPVTLKSRCGRCGGLRLR